MDLFKGTFVYPHKPVIIQLKAVSVKQAWTRMVRKMAQRDDVHPGLVFGLFPWNKRGENFDIKQITCKVRFGNETGKNSRKSKRGSGIRG